MGVCAAPWSAVASVARHRLGDARARDCAGAPAGKPSQGGVALRFPSHSKAAAVLADAQAIFHGGFAIRQRCRTQTWRLYF